MSVKIVPITDLRRSATALADEVLQSGEPIYVTHRGRPHVVLIGYEIYEALLARLRDLESLLAVWQGLRPEGFGELSRTAGPEGLEMAPEGQASRFSKSAGPFVQKLLAHNRPLFEELARR